MVVRADLTTHVHGSQCGVRWEKGTNPVFGTSGTQTKRGIERKTKANEPRGKVYGGAIH